MTSSERHLTAGQARWNYNDPRYKDTDDVFCEPGLISVIVLAHGRPDTTKKSILSTLKAVEDYDGEVEWIFIENGGDVKNQEFFMSLPLERKVIVVQNNYGINEGLNQGWALSRGEYILIHENDWICEYTIDFFHIAQSIFSSREQVGIIQLRDPRDPKENHGLYKPEYNPWSCDQAMLDEAGVKLWDEKTHDAHRFLVSDFSNGFNNNPVFIRKSLYRECGPYPEPVVGSDPRHGETLYQKQVADIGCEIAHIGLPLYRHLGHTQTQAR